MKKLLLLSISILCLSISALIGFHIGSSSVRAKTPASSIAGLAFWNDEAHVILENGDMYRNNVIPRGPAVNVGNYWGGERLRPGDSPQREGDQGGDGDDSP